MTVAALPPGIDVGSIDRVLALDLSACNSSAVYAQRLAMDSATPPSLHVLAEMFRAARLPRAQWTHLAHLRVGAWHVHHFGPTEALVRLRHGIRALNVSNGVANTPTDGYHETITAAYVTLISEFLSAADPALTLERKVEEMLAGPLAERTVLLRFWSKETLMSPAARAAWVAPNLAPLRLA